MSNKAPSENENSLLGTMVFRRFSGRTGYDLVSAKETVLVHSPLSWNLGKIGKKKVSFN